MQIFATSINIGFRNKIAKKTMKHLKLQRIGTKHPLNQETFYWFRSEDVL